MKHPEVIILMYLLQSHWIAIFFYIEKCPQIGNHVNFAKIAEKRGIWTVRLDLQVSLVFRIRMAAVLVSTSMKGISFSVSIPRVS